MDMPTEYKCRNCEARCVLRMQDTGKIPDRHGTCCPAGIDAKWDFGLTLEEDYECQDCHSQLLAYECEPELQCRFCDSYNLVKLKE